jgi:hypothetical protein
LILAQGADPVKVAYVINFAPGMPDNKPDMTVGEREDYPTIAHAIARVINSRAVFSADASHIFAERRSQLTIWAPTKDEAHTEYSRALTLM